MKLVKLGFCFFSVLEIFSCSSKPVEFYPARRNQPSRPSAHDKKTKDLPEKNYTTETVVANSSTPYSASPYGLVSTGTAAGDSNHSESSPLVVGGDPLLVLKNPNTNKKTAEDLILNHLSTAQLESALKEPSIVAYKPLMFWQMAQLYQKNKRTSQALEYYRALSSQYPQHHLTVQSNAMIALLQASQEVDSKVIGAILPLTGKNANVGQHALNALKMALGVDKPGAKFKVVAYDTQSSAELATSSVDKLLIDDKAIAVIGGLSSKEATLIAQRSELLSLPFIALSQKPGLTNIGDYVFRNSLTPEMQVDQLVSYAFQKLNAKRFAILYPNDSYGVEFSNIFWDQVLARGGQITAAQTYDSKENDFTGIIQKMVGTYYPEARPEEYKERFGAMKKNKLERAKKNKNKSVVKNSREHESEENVLQPILDFDVLFLPDSGKTLGQVMAFMKVNDVSNITYLGTNIWNNPDIVKRSASQKENIYFVDAIDPNDNSIRDSEFFKEYFAAYNEEPTLIEVQTFESAQILRDQINSGATTRDSLASKLRIMGRSTGVTGDLRMSNQREIERPIHVLSLENGLIKKMN
jgi:ABC-type branched-subunit amino acid transport system substrate-binding protein